MSKLKTSLAIWLGIWSLALGFSTASAAPAAWPDGDFIAHIKVIDKQFAVSAPKYPVLTGIRVVKTANIINYSLTWSKGAATMVCKDLRSGQTIEQHTNGSIFVSTGQSLTVSRLAGMDGPALDWLIPSAFQGEDFYKELTKGKKLHRYRREVPVPPDGTVLYQAWIDPETKLPVALDDSQYIYEFTYSDKKPQPRLENNLENQPDLPGVMKKELERRKKALEP